MEIKFSILEAAKKAYSNAYAPYSQFSVGAALLAEDGQIYAGCNVENAAYPQGLCAEASAIAAMATHGARQIKHIVVYTKANHPIFPCGGCRQKILEFANPATTIEVVTSDEVSFYGQFSELVPFGFNKDSLLSNQPSEKL